MSDRLFSRRTLAILTLLFAVVWFGSLDYRKLIRPDEGRYAEIAREMAASGDWVTPRLNGLIYLEKPPLQYWTTAAAFRAFGEHDWVARIWPATTGFLGILLAVFTGTRLFGRQAGILAGLALGTSLFYFVIGHLNTLDMGLCFFLELALCSFLLSKHASAPSRAGRNWMALAWAAMAFAVLSKGLIALLIPAGTLIVYSMLTRDTTPWRGLRLLPGFALLLILAAPWHILAQLRTPEFADFYFLHEHLTRFLTTEHRRVQPWWYYGPLLLAAAMPWSLIAIHALIAGWKQADRSGPTLRLLIVWCAFTVAFFSASGSKLPSYILPVLPALAMLVGHFLTRIPMRTLRLHLVAVALLAAASLVLTQAAPAYIASPESLAAFTRYRGWLVASSALWLAASLAALRLISGNPGRAVVAVACGATGFALMAMLGHETLSDSHSAWRLARELRQQIPAQAPVFVVREFDHTLPYYLQRSLILVDYRDEMDFGLSLEPGRGVPSVAEFELRWRAEPHAFAVMAENTRLELESRGLPMRIVARDPRHVVISKPDPGDS